MSSFITMCSTNPIINLLSLLSFIMIVVFGTGCVEPIGSQSTVINSEVGGTSATGMEMGGSRTGGYSMGGTPNQSGRPNLMRIGDKVAVVGELLSIQLMATDPQNDMVSFSLRSALPDGAKFEKDRGLFTWTPTPTQIGSILLTFEVSDGMLKDQETIAVRVSAAGSQEQFPPKIDPIGSLLINAGEPWSFQLVGEDLNNQPLTYRLNGMIPDGVNLSAMTGLITWTPAMNQIGQYNLVAAVSDGQSEDSTPMIIIVQDANSQSNSNRPPVFDQIPPQTVVVGQNLTFEISAVDEMPTNLMYQADTIPEGSEFRPGIRQFSWTPNSDQSGTSHEAIFVVNDGEYRAFLNVSIEVTRMISSCPQDPAGMIGGSAPLSEGALLEGRILCDQTEVDNYEINLNRPGRLDITANFEHTLGDIDLFLFNSTNERLAIANGFTNEERLTSSNLMPGTYRLEVKMYTGDGPAQYSIGYTVADTTVICEPDPLEGAGNDSPNFPTPITGGLDYSLGLCANDIDYYSFEVQRADSIEINANFRHMISDIDLRLISSPGSSGTPFQEWYASSSSDDEQIIVPSAPVAGTYILEVKQIATDREPQYNLRIDLQQAAECMEDRFGSYNSPQNSYFAVPELYRDLMACSAEDWYETTISQGKSLILYLTYDEGTPIINAQTNGRELTPIAQTFFNPVDGCLTNRLNCKRYLIDPGPSGGDIQYGVSFFEVGIEYDLRVRTGDEVGASCFDELDCNSDYECIYDFDIYRFDFGLCSKACDTDTDCGQGRVCIEDGFGAEMCMQRCDNGLSCRYEFTCMPGISSTSNETVSACLSDTYIDD